MTTPTILTPREVADHLRIHVTTVKRMIDRGDLTGTRVGTQLRIHASSLHAYLEANRITPTTKPVTLRRQRSPEATAYPWLTNAS